MIKAKNIKIFSLLIMTSILFILNKSTLDLLFLLKELLIKLTKNFIKNK